MSNPLSSLFEKLFWSAGKVLFHKLGEHNKFPTDAEMSGSAISVLNAPRVIEELQREMDKAEDASFEKNAPTIGNKNK